MEKIIDGKEKIIDHIQQKLQFLKLQRDSLIRQSTKPSANIQKVNISKFSQKQNINVVVRVKEKDEFKSSKGIDFDQFPQEKVYSKAQILERQIQAKKRCEQLKDLLQKKKKLESIGLYESEPNKIKKIFENKSLSNDIHKNLVERQKQEQKRVQRQKIIQQQMTKAQSFLQQSKKSNNKKAKQNQFSYTQLLLNKQNQLKQYEKLLSKRSHSLLQKENLLEKTFDILKQYPSRVLKNKLQSFLLANQIFCTIFLITKAEILRDLSVYQTSDQGYLNYNEFYQFIKSIEITNKAIKPNINFKAKSSSSEQIQFKTAASKKTPRQVEEYLRKIFNYLDQKKQRFVQRQRLEIALEKGLLIDKKCNINKQMISKFSQYIKSKKQAADNKKYYKKLDQRYISVEQLLQLYKQFTKIDIKKEEQEEQLQFYKDEQSQNISQQQNKREEYRQPQKKEEDQIEVDQRNDFQKYGWQKDSEQQHQFSQLKQMDKYYKDLSNKHGNQIHWNGFQVYKQDFSKFNQAIAKLRQKQQQSLQSKIIFDFHAPVQQQEIQESQQMQ